MSKKVSVSKKQLTATGEELEIVGEVAAGGRRVEGDGRRGRFGSG